MATRRLFPPSPTGAVIDQLIEGYVVWREACAAVQAAYDVWRRAPEDQAGAAFADYVAALNWEERAAEDYEFLAARARHVDHEYGRAPDQWRRSAEA